jgi:lysozyme
MLIVAASMAPGKKKSSRNLRNLMVFTAVAGGVFIAVIAWLWISGTRQPKFVTYPEFGIPIPSNYEIHGIDVSRYQQRISWEAVKAMHVNNVRLGFAFIKATEGNSNTDPFFKRNWKKAREAGIVRGAYHFFLPWKDGRTQAENFISQVTLESGDLPPVLDIEQAGRTPVKKLREETLEWLLIMEEQYGVKPIIYTNVEFYKKYLEGHFDDYPLWVAHYLQPHQPRITRDWHFWQHSEQGRVNGINSRVDFNVFNGDSLRFRSLLVP